MPIIETPVRSEGSGLGGGVHVASAAYVFATEGGAQSTIALTGATFVPSGAIVWGGYLEVTVVPTGAGASIAVQVEAANDLVTASAISGAPWSSTGRKSLIPVSGATSVKTTAARDVSIVISAAALTAGTFKVVLFYTVA